MNVIVFGSTGPTGRHVVELALEHGHAVTAFARTPSKLSIEHEALTVVQGDATDAASVADAIPGHDAVVCALGAPGLDKSGIRAAGIRHIVDGMNRAGVKRLVCLSSLGVGESRRILPWTLRLVIIPLLLRHAFADHEEQEKLVRASDLDWTLVRPPHLNDGPSRGTYRFGFPSVRGLKLKLSRTDLAAFMVRQLTDETYVRQAVAVSD